MRLRWEEPYAFRPERTRLSLKFQTQRIVIIRRRRRLLVKIITIIQLSAQRFHALFRKVPEEYFYVRKLPLNCHRENIRQMLLCME